MTEDKSRKPAGMSTVPRDSCCLGAGESDGYIRKNFL